MIDTSKSKLTWDYAYKMGKIQGIINGYHSNVVRCVDALLQISKVCDEPLESEKTTERSKK